MVHDLHALVVSVRNRLVFIGEDEAVGVALHGYVSAGQSGPVLRLEGAEGEVIGSSV